MVLAPRFSLLIKALATIEMVGRTLDPRLDMVPIIQPYLERMIKKRFAPRQLFRDFQHNSRVLLRLGHQVPRDVSQLLRQLRQGKLKFSIHHEHLEDLAATVDRASSRNTVGMIVAALIVGSSLLITVETSISRLGVAGFVFAGLLGSVLVISILWTRKF
jgi:ubiquinone biosynthesis protein